MLARSKVSVKEFFTLNSVSDAASMFELSVSYKLCSLSP